MTADTIFLDSRHSPLVELQTARYPSYFEFDMPFTSNYVVQFHSVAQAGKFLFRAEPLVLGHGALQLVVKLTYCRKGTPFCHKPSFESSKMVIGRSMRSAHAAAKNWKIGYRSVTSHPNAGYHRSRDQN
jgi:hypothetical protein